MEPLAGNYFLTIVEGREYLRALGNKVLWEGALEVVFETFKRVQERCHRLDPFSAVPVGSADAQDRRIWGGSSFGA